MFGNDEVPLFIPVARDFLYECTVRVDELILKKRVIVAI